MANNMRSFIEVKGNEDVIKMVDQRIDRVEELSKDKEFDNGNGVRAFAAAFYDTVNVSTDGKSVMNDWSLDNMGSKWTYLYDVQADGEFSIESAWYPPKEFFIHLYKLCLEIDPDSSIEVTYEDEGYSPIGAYVLSKDLDGTPCIWNEEDHDMEDPTSDMDWDDEDYEQTQSDFMDSIYDRTQELLQDCRTYVLSDGEPVVEMGEDE